MPAPFPQTPSPLAGKTQLYQLQVWLKFVSHPRGPPQGKMIMRDPVTNSVNTVVNPATTKRTKFTKRIARTRPRRYAKPGKNPGNSRGCA